MRTLKILRGAAALLIGVAALVSCNNEEYNDDPGGQAGTGGDIRFEIGFAPQTRVSTAADFTSEWEYGDQIGIFAVAHGQALSATASDNHINNVKLTYTSAGGGTWSGPAYWPATASGITSLDFYAYHPYNPLANNPAAIAFNVKTGQSTAADYSASDLLTAKSDNSGNGWGKGSTVSLQFSHALAMVQVKIEDQVGALDIGEDITVKLRGVKPGATLDLSAISTPPGNGITVPDTDNDATNITMYRVADAEGYVYRALVPAQTLAQNTSVFRISNGDVLLDGSKLSADLAMTAGHAETFTQKTPYTALPLIPKGTFLMGSSDGNNSSGNPDEPNYAPAEFNRQLNETQHKVTLSKDFHMSKYQITNTQYAAFLNAKGVQGESLQPIAMPMSMTGGKCGWGDNNGQHLVYDGSGTAFEWGVKWDDNKWVPQTGYENHPVIWVTWYGAVEYCAWLSETTDTECSLPTEAQWEYACRGGKENQPFGIGDGTKLTGGMANFNVRYSYDILQNGEYEDAAGYSSYYKGKTTPVGSYPYANGYGLYDMHGNVSEWCLDQWDGSDNYLSLADPDPICTTGINRVLRGGNWDGRAQDCRSAYRGGSNPVNARDYFGFRVAFVP